MGMITISLAYDWVLPCAAARSGAAPVAVECRQRIPEGAPLSMEVAMMRRQMPAGFDEFDQSPESDRGVTAAWIIVILLLVATSVGLLLDHAATITP
jgi:hypothetical protein